MWSSVLKCTLPNQGAQVLSLVREGLRAAWQCKKKKKDDLGVEWNEGWEEVKRQGT